MRRAVTSALLVFSPNRNASVEKMIITEDHLNEIADPEVIVHGRRLFHGGRVSKTKEEEHSVSFDVLANGEVSKVQLFLDESSIESSCSCGYDWGGVCKHVIGGMIALMYDQAGVVYSPRHMPLPDDSEKVAYSRASYWADQIHKLIPLQDRNGSSGRPRVRNRGVYTIRWNDGQPRVSTGAKKKAGIGTQNEITIQVDDEMSVEDKSEPTDIQMETDLTWDDAVAIVQGKEIYLRSVYRAEDQKANVLYDVVRFRLRLAESGGGIEMSGELVKDKETSNLPKDVLILSSKPLWIHTGNVISRVEGVHVEDLRILRELTLPMFIPFRDRRTFFENALPSLLQRFEVECDIPSLARVCTKPEPRLYLMEVGGMLQIELRFSYAGLEVQDFGEKGEVRPFDILQQDEGFTLVERNPHKEREFREAIMQSGLRVRREMVQPPVYSPLLHPLEWLHTALPELQKNGFLIFGKELKNHRLRQSAPTMRVRVSSGIDWFDLKLGIDFDGKGVSMEEILKTVGRGERFVKLDDNSFGVLPEEWVKKFQRTIALADKTQDSIQFSRTQISAVTELLDDADEIDVDATFEEMRERLSSFVVLESQKLPENFVGELRPYQKSGYDWLFFLNEFRFGGILADDMGLGKTIQTLALLQKIYEQEETQASLVVVPTSLIFNWQNEAAKFTPTLRVLCYSGHGRRKHFKELDKYHVIITSYGILRRDIDLLRGLEFAYVVLDESQNIKNPVSQNARAARQLQARHRLALTGTPVENNLMELWSQFAFLNKGMLGSEHAFADNFANPIERQTDSEAAAMLKRIVYPFMLRRTKEIVANDLPPKQESIVMCEMDKQQRTAYNHWRDYYRNAILNTIEEGGVSRSKLKVLEGLTMLRQVCCHPVLVDRNYRGTSGKFEAFVEMLDDILAEGHKVLVFSQFVKMLTLLRLHCDEKSISFEYLDGRTTNRQERVERFQDDDSIKLFLISLRAGGTGLNLTAADYVIHYDPWWNPAVEVQATDRTHRIGQTKHVFSYKLITKESVEEKILALQEKKRKLVKELITTDGGLVKSLTREDIEMLFA